MFDRYMAIVAGLVVLGPGLLIGVLHTTFLHNNVEVFGAMLAWYSLTIGCGALLMWPRDP